MSKILLNKALQLKDIYEPSYLNSLSVNEKKEFLKANKKQIEKNYRNMRYNLSVAKDLEKLKIYKEKIELKNKRVIKAKIKRKENYILKKQLKNFADIDIQPSQRKTRQQRLNDTVYFDKKLIVNFKIVNKSLNNNLRTAVVRYIPEDRRRYMRLHMRSFYEHNNKMYISINDDNLYAIATGILNAYNKFKTNYSIININQSITKVIF